MRTLVIALLLSLAAATAFGYTFVLKSGKRIEGVLLFEEDRTIRIEDFTGVKMTLKKSNLDFAAMKALNQIQQAEEQRKQEEAAVSSETKRPALRKVVQPRENAYTHRQFEPPQTESESYWRKQVAIARRSLDRLKAACRSAGSSSSYGKVLRTETYWIDGRPVNVTGYWAHPANVENAKRICNDAIHAQITLEIAQQKLKEYQYKGGLSSIGGSR